jgi:hypothetical protein
MPYEDGWAAINLEMPTRVPRTEYSAEGHWELIRRVTGIDVSAESMDDVKARAVRAFYIAWKYDFYWSTSVKVDFGKWQTNMGHAEYAAGGVDRDDNVACPFQTPEEVLAFDPVESLPHQDKGAITRQAEEAYKRHCAENPDGVSMTGIYYTCVSGLIQIFGWDMLLTAAGLDAERFGRLTDRYCQWIGRYYEALAAADVPVVMVHDDIVWTSGAFVRPEWYRRYVFPNYRRMFGPLRDSGKKIMYTSDGNYTDFIDDIAACGVNGFVMEPATDMRYVAERYGRTHAFIGNADTRVLLSGTKAEIRAEVERCMAIGKKCPGFFMAVGNHIPPNTPVENAVYYNDVYEELSAR